jgi:hypothetical protein
MAGTQNNQALTERLLDDLGKLMWSMVWDVANHDRWMLEPDEVHAELCLELVKLVGKYHQLPYPDLKEVCKTSLRNRVKDLASMCYLTNRRAEARMLSLDAGSDDDHDNHDTSLELAPFTTGTFSTAYNKSYTIDDNRFDLDEFCDGMSDDAKVLVREVLWPSKRTAYFLWLAAQRKQQACTKGFWTLTITPIIMTRSLGWTSERLKAAWSEISHSMSNGVDLNGGLVG